MPRAPHTAHRDRKTWLFHHCNLTRRHPRRLQPLHRRLEALHEHEGRRCYWHIGVGPPGVRLRLGNGPA